MVRIPSEYQEVEWIGGATGIQYINTGIPGNNDSLVIKGKVLVRDWTSYQAFFGNHTGNESDNVTRLILNNINNGILIPDVNRRSSGSATVNVHFTLGDVHEFTLTKNNLIFDGNTYAYAGNAVGNENDLNIALNANSVSNPKAHNGVKQWYYFQIYDGDTILRNFIPCYRKSDNEPGMYDTVSKTFFTNSGTGTFLVGNDVNYSNTNLLEVRRRILLNTPHIESMSGNPAIFTTDMAANLKECKIRFSPVQAGEGTPSPENVRAISGWDGISLKIQKGKNYLPSIDMVVWRIGYFNNSGKAINNDAYYRTNPILVPAGDYTLSTKYGRWKGIFAKDQNDATVAFTERNANAITVTLPTSAYIQVYVDSSSEEVQLENNSIATDYEPSKNTSFLIKDVSLNTKNILPPFNLTFWYSGYFNSSGEKRSGGAYVNSTPIKVSAGSYTLSSENTAWKGVYAEDLEGNKTVFKELLGKTLTVDIPVDGYIRVYLESIQNAQLEYGTEATPYEPYVEPQTISIPFPQTIFGGYVDLIKGEVVEEWTKITLPTTGWSKQSYNVFSHPISGRQTTISTTDSGLVCDRYNTYITIPITQLNTLPDISICGRSTYSTVFIRDTKYDNASDFQSSLVDAELAYKLATPNVYSLTPQTINALKGLNNLYSDANGNVEVKFWKH